MWRQKRGAMKVNKVKEGTGGVGGGWGGGGFELIKLDI